MRFIASFFVAARSIFALIVCGSDSVVMIWSGC